MKNKTMKAVAGFTILEGLISLVVVAVGAAGIAMLNSVLLQTTGESKARGEAAKVAQAWVEDAREFVLEDGCASLTLGTYTPDDPYIGVNANYSITRTLSAIDSDSPWRDVTVCVTWDGGTCGQPGNRVLLSSTVSCAGTGTSARATGDAAAGIGNFIKTPSGRATVGGNPVPGETGTPNTIQIGPNDTVEDGTQTVVRDDGYSLALLDLDGNVLLTVPRLPCEDTPPAFSTISGKVFVGTNNQGNPIAADANLFVLSSDASYCARLPYDPAWVLPAGATGNQVKYRYTYYQCYIGAEWWGNIGLVRTDNANSNDRVCVGNPLDSNINTIFSRHSQRSTTRGYRGYRDLPNNRYETQGIGESADQVNAACSTRTKTVYQYTPNHLRGHHFVHANITGQSTCQTKMVELNNFNPQYSLGQTAGAPNTVATLADPAQKIITANTNPGRFYCMSNDDGITCRDVGLGGDPRETLLRGEIVRVPNPIADGIQPQLTGITGLDNACETTTWSVNAAGNYEYTCQINWQGFPGSSWSGHIRFSAATAAPDTTLCEGDNWSLAVVPVEEEVVAGVVGRFDSSFPNTLRFDAVPSSVEEITVNFSTNYGSCGGGPQGVPFPQWVNASETGTTRPRLQWSPIQGATQYQIDSCSPQGNATTCTPTWAAVDATFSDTLFNVPALGNNQTVCYSVRAIDGNLTGNPSERRCVVYRNNGGWACDGADCN